MYTPLVVVVVDVVELYTFDQSALRYFFSEEKILSLPILYNSQAKNMHSETLSDHSLSTLTKLSSCSWAFEHWAFEQFKWK